jgi:glycosyltransferase involved in cell wall biosynthesis
VAKTRRPDRRVELEGTVDAPQVSVVIPTWNRADDAVLAVESVLAQEGVTFEVLVVDDGSTDGTAETLARRFPAEPRLQVLRQPNGGTAQARNTGVARARGPYTALLDSDDRWLPGHLVAQVEALERAPEADLAVCDAEYVDETGRVVGSYGDRVHGRPPMSLADMLAGGWSLPSCWMLRTPVIRHLGFASDWRTEDTEFLFRFFAAGHRAVFTPRVLTRYAAEDLGRGAPRKMASERIAKADQLRLMEAYAAQAPDPAGHALKLARRRALYLAREGRWREARRDAFAWWRRRPWEIRPLRLILRSYVARRPLP